MKNILIIAKNTFKETIRDRVLYVILAFALLFLLSTLMFGTISLGEDLKIIKDLGLAGIYIFSLIITIFLGASLIYKEIEKRTLYIMLSKPVSIFQFILGKFAGLLLSILLNTAIMTIIYLIVVGLKGGGFDYLSLYSFMLSLFELAFFIALSILFSTITTPLSSAIYSIILLYIGHSLTMLNDYAQKTGLMKYFFQFAYYLLPNLEKFNIRNSIAHEVAPSAAQVLYPILYSCLYTTILLWVAILALKKQDL